MKPFSPIQQARIVSNIMAAIAMHIGKLNGPAYRFISGCPGFIAHYNLHGFKAHYDVDQWGHSLARDILANQPINQWANFKPGQDWYEYNMSRKAIYNQICNNLRD
jgi:hypothetical protein